MSEIVDEAFCAQDENKTDERCSCYNTIYRDCETERGIPGCKEAMKYVEDTLANVPETAGPHKAVARLELMQRLYCPAKVCVGTDKYKPPIMDDLRKTSPCGFKLNICLQNTEINTALDTDVFSECKINENFIGTDPWELDFYNEERGEIEENQSKKDERMELRKKELEEKQKQRDEEAKKFNTMLAAFGVAFLIIVLVVVLLK